MYKDFLFQTFTVTRTTTAKDATTHIATKTTETFGYYPCRISRTTGNGNTVQASLQSVYTQTLRLYTLIDSDIQVGDIVTVDSTKYNVINVYKVANHHIEADITYKEEV